MWFLTPVATKMGISVNASKVEVDPSGPNFPCYAS